MENNGQFEKHLAEGGLHLLVQNFAAAEGVFKSALELRPEDVRALRGRVQALRGLERYTEAQAALDGALSIYPDDVGLLVEKINVASALGSGEQARAALEQALAATPESAENRLAKVGLLAGLNFPDKAEELIKETVAKFPGDNEVLFGCASTYLRMQRPGEAVELLTQAGGEGMIAAYVEGTTAAGDVGMADQLSLEALEKSPESLVLARTRAMYLHNTKRYEEAVECADRALKADPNDLEATGIKISSLRLLGGDGKPELIAEAARLVEEALVKFPDSTKMGVEAARVFIAQEDFDRAGEIYDALLKKEPANPVVVAGKSFVLRKQGRAGAREKFQAAEALLLGALEHEPKDAGLQNELGWLRYDQGQYEQAVEVFAGTGNEAVATAILKERGEKTPAGQLGSLCERAAEAFAKSPNVLILCGAISYDAQKFEEAVKFYDRALAADPNFGMAHEWKIRSLRQMGLDGRPEKLGEAERAAAGALKLLPGLPRLLTQQGWVFFEQKRHAEAVESFLQADDEESARLAASRLAARYQFEEGKRLLDLALERRPQSARLLRELAMLEQSRNRFGDALSAYEKALAVEPADAWSAVGRLVALNQLGRGEEAERAIPELRARFRDDGQFWLMLGFYYLDRREYDRSLECYDRALEINKDDLSARQNKISALRMLGRCDGDGRIKEAEQLADEVLKQERPPAEFLYERGWLYLDQELPAEAERCFARACRESPGYTAAAYAHAEALHRLDQGAKALAVYESLLKARPEDLEVRNQLGWFHIGRGDAKLAEREFRAILKRDGQNIIAKNGLGGVHFELGEYDEAEKYFREVVQAVPSEPVYHANLAWALVRQGSAKDLAEAERHSLKALEIDPRFAAAHGCRGVIAFKRGDLRRSEEHFRESIRVNPREGSYTDLGALYVQTGRYDEAAEILKKALQINRFDLQALIELGNLHLLTDKNKEAVRTFRQARALNPSSEEAHRALGGALMRAGDLDEAEKVLRAAVGSLDRRQRWRLHLLLSQVLIKRGDDTNNNQWYEEALKEADKAIELAPNQPDPYFYAGVIRYNLDDYGRAMRRFRDCLDKNPDHYEADRNLRLVQTLVRKEKTLQFGSYIGAALLIIVSLSQLVFLWWARIRLHERVSENMLMVMIPILLGLFVVAFLLPGLVRLKLPGMEAELSQPKQKETIASGPKGAVGISLPSSTSTGPR